MNCYSELVLVDLSWSPGIDSQPGRPVLQHFLKYWPTRLHRLAEFNPRNRLLGSINVYSTQIGAQTEKDREEEGLRRQRSNVLQDGNGNAVLTAKIYCTFVCFVDLFQSILMYGRQRLKLKETSREGAVTSSDPLYAYSPCGCIHLISATNLICISACSSRISHSCFVLSRRSCF